MEGVRIQVIINFALNEKPEPKNTTIRLEIRLSSLRSPSFSLEVPSGDNVSK